MPGLLRFAALRQDLPMPRAVQSPNKAARVQFPRRVMTDE